MSYYGLLNQLTNFVGIFHVTQRISGTKADSAPFEHGSQRAHIHPQTLYFRQLGTGNIQPDQPGGEIQAFIGERIINAVPVEKAVNRRKYCVPHQSQMKKYEEIQA